MCPTCCVCVPVDQILQSTVGLFIAGPMARQLGEGMECCDATCIWYHLVRSFRKFVNYSILWVHCRTLAIGNLHGTDGGTPRYISRSLILDARTRTDVGCQGIHQSSAENTETVPAYPSLSKQQLRAMFKFMIYDGRWV